MIKIDIFSGFLGAGKTTLIKKLLKEAYVNEKIVLIENEFGEIGIDGGFLQDAGVMVNEMNSGCICCSLVGDFAKALEQVITEYAPDRIIIEPSGVGKLSDVIKAVESVADHNVKLNGFVTVADVNKCKMYIKNFGEFYVDQIENASAIVLSHTQTASDKKVSDCVELLREHNKTAVIVTAPWDQLSGDQIVNAMEQTDTLDAQMDKLKHDHEHHHEHHHHHHHDEECDCGCHDHDHEHHHDHDHEHHHHDHEHHHHHHHHHADEVFESWGVESTKRYSAEQIEHVLCELENSDKYGFILRAKGIVMSEGDKWIHFDYVPEEPNVRYGSASVIGRICVIGSKIDKEAIAALFDL